ncbi:hypothetical protein CPB85DRAFT_1345280 [Mucidula mucida]|nr:hypothetical protein CPB85DRAFT_1345280 [Mucidula mucida]
MHALYHWTFPTKPMKPREPQKSAWDSHPEFRRFVLYIWLLIAAGYYWCFIIWAMTISGTQGAHKGTSWSLLPDEAGGRMNLGWEGEAPDSGMLWGMGVLVGFQGGIITTAFTCVDLLLLLSRDERIWVDAALNGADMSPGLWRMLLPNWHKLVIYVMDPTFHWVFGISVSFDAKVGLQIRYVQILYICLLGTFGNALITYISMSRPNRRVPSTYGHLQTLVNLIDEWPSGRTLYWGEKRRFDSWDDLNVRHAGTSSEKSDVTAISMDAFYGGNDQC